MLLRLRVTRIDRGGEVVTLHLRPTLSPNREVDHVTEVDDRTIVHRLGHSSADSRVAACPRASSAADIGSWESLLLLSRDPGAPRFVLQE